VYFDIVYKLLLPEWLKDVWNLTEQMLDDLIEQLCYYELSVNRNNMMFYSDIEGLKSYIRNHREHRFFAERQTIVAEYYRVWLTARYAITESVSAMLAYTKETMAKDGTNASERLSHQEEFRQIIEICQKSNQHPKVAKLAELVSRYNLGEKVLVICGQKKTAEEIVSCLLTKAVVPLHGGVRQFEKAFAEFSRMNSGVAVTTASLKRKLGLKVDTIVHYNLISADLSYIDSLTPFPRRQSILLAVDHEFDLGSRFKAIKARLKPLPTRRSWRHQKDNLTPDLFKSLTDK